MSNIETTVVTVRFFAAARAAAGAETSVLNLSPSATIGDAINALCDQSDELAQVLQKCSFLCDGVAVRDQAIALQTCQILDVLPPFSGG